MKKYIISEKNFHQVAGEINKFIKSCYEKSDGIYSWFSDKGKLTQVSDDGLYSELDIIKEAYAKPVIDCIGVYFPGNFFIIPMGAVVYFNGGNRIVFKGVFDDVNIFAERVVKDTFELDYTCVNDDVYCECRSCIENKANGGDCTHCFNCIDGERSANDCIDFVSINEDTPRSEFDHDVMCPPIPCNIKAAHWFEGDTMCVVPCDDKKEDC